VTRAYLALGSNLGDRLENLRSAVALLGERDVRPIRSSRVYETEPVGGPPQPEYLNAVIEVETELDAGDLLRACLDVEDVLGRVRSERWGPRTLDVDVLTFGRDRIDRSDLVIPHPRMHQRAFVLVPLLELDADPPLPGDRRVAELRLDPRVLGGVRPVEPPLVPEAAPTA
jgi:2-amino-4-hydroxy-6-hydroxymethyldihydropteridine diphosphokinase